MVGPQPLLLDSRALVHIERGESKEALEDLDSIPADKTIRSGSSTRPGRCCLEGVPEQAVIPLAEAHNKGLNRAMIDPPERTRYDDLERELAKSDDQN